MSDNARSSLYQLTITEALHSMRAGELTSVELTRSLLDRINAVDGSIKAYLTVTPDRALEQAAQADHRRQQGEDAPLLGVPLAIKDVLATTRRADYLRQPDTQGIYPTVHCHCSEPAAGRRHGAAGQGQYG